MKPPESRDPTPEQAIMVFSQEIENMLPMKNMGQTVAKYRFMQVCMKVLADFVAAHNEKEAGDVATASAGSPQLAGAGNSPSADPGTLPQG